MLCRRDTDRGLVTVYSCSLQLYSCIEQEILVLQILYMWDANENLNYCKRAPPARSCALTANWSHETQIAL